MPPSTEGGTPPATEASMKRFLRWVIAILVTLFVVLIGFLLVKDPIFKALAERSLQEETGLRAEIGEFKSTLFSGELHVRDLKLYNPAAFGGSLMASVPELVVDLNAAQAADAKLHFRNLKVTLSELNVVRNAEGRLNLEGVQKTLRERFARRKRKKGERFEFEFAGIDQMQLTLGKVHYIDFKYSALNRALDLGVQDELVTGLKTEEDLQRWAGALLFRILVQVSLGDLEKATRHGSRPGWN
jgi:uncharacterized protein involved in outer membrane biogenesis